MNLMTKQAKDNYSLKNDNVTLDYQAVVIGVSAGGMNALAEIVPKLPIDYSLVVVVVQHLLKDSPSMLAEFLNRQAALVVQEALDKKPIHANTVYIAPPAYHYR